MQEKLFCWLLCGLGLVLLSFNDARGDIAPNPTTGGHQVVPYEEKITDVRMVAENVLVQIYPDSVVTVGTFSMLNEGKSVDMVVGFPFPYENDIIRFSAFVDGRPVDVRDGKRDHSNPERGKKWTVYWRLWDMRFQEGRACEIRVEYRTNPSKSQPFKWTEGRESLPMDVSESLEKAMAIHEVEYVLYTGKEWKGVLDRCKVSFELVGMSDAHIIGFYPEDGILATNGVTWEYTGYEPKGWARLTYSPYATVQQATQVVLGVIEQNPDNGELVMDLAGFCSGYLRKHELESEILHSFVARWNEPIPQLLEYASGGRCRVNYKGAGDFYTTWRMAYQLFMRYKSAGELENGRDIAERVSVMSQAIVDSLAICGGLREKKWFERSAGELRDLCNELLEE